MSPSYSGAKIRRQGRGNPKTRYPIRWDNGLYDYLIRRAKTERKSVAVLVNEIISREKDGEKRGDYTLDTETPVRY